MEASEDVSARNRPSDVGHMRWPVRKIKALMAFCLQNFYTRGGARFDARP
ncbi:hypothetical protein CFII64_16522 [Pseudomonas sp. CFII64]|nr:hypothetical protein CFII64_16522 [Pseudomonas sp. CFII64]